MSRSTQESLQQAAAWMARLWADDVSTQDRQAFQDWQQRSPDNAFAWRQLEQLQQKFNSLPQPNASSKILGRPNAPARRQFLLWGGVSVAVLALSARYTVPDGTLYATAIGEQNTLTLRDGTVIMMNTNTQVRVNMNDAVRQLYLLRGEVMITTAHHATPFELYTAQGSVVPLGTRFVVRQYKRESHVKVHEGEVELRPALSGQLGRVKSGEQGCFNTDGVMPVQVLEQGADLWAEQKLVANSQPLHKFIAELARYRTGVVNLEPSLASLRITGVFTVQDTDSVLRHLAQVLPIKIRYLTRYWVSIYPQ